jgi:hypothetical protein
MRLKVMRGMPTRPAARRRSKPTAVSALGHIALIVSSVATTK